MLSIVFFVEKVAWPQVTVVSWWGKAASPAIDIVTYATIFDLHPKAPRQISSWCAGVERNF